MELSRRSLITGGTALAAYSGLECWDAEAAAPADALLERNQFYAYPLPHWRAAKALVAAGSRNAKLLILSDSTGAGQGSTNAGQGANCVSQAWPTQLAALLQTATGLKCSWQSRMSTGGFGNNFIACDSRCAATGTMVYTGVGINAVGGPLIKGAGTATFSFTPTTSVDTFVIRYPVNAGLGTMQANIDGGANTPIMQAGSASMGSTALTAGSAGTHTLNLSLVNNCYIDSIVAYTAAQKEISILNAGWCGSTAANWNDATAVWSPINDIPNLAPDLSIICLTINDWNAGTSLAAYIASIQTVISACLKTGDVLLCTGIASNPAAGDAPGAVQQQYAAAVSYLARANGLRLPINFANVLGGSWAVANAAGKMYDDKHGLAAGYDRMAQALVQPLAA